MTQISDNLRGALFMMGSMAGFVGSDAIMKSVSDDLSLYQAIFLRGLIATSLLASLAWQQGAFKEFPRGKDLQITLVRSVADLAAALCFLTALFQIGLAHLTAIAMAAPLVITLAGVVFLGHKVGWRRYAAIVAGFIGVLLIVKPGAAGFDAYSLWGLASVGFVVLRDLATRGLSTQVPSLVVAMCTSGGATLAGGLIALFGDWPDDILQPLLKLVFCAMFLIVGLVFSVSAMRVGEVAVVSPFRYSAIIVAVVLGYLVFGEVPDLWAATGSLIVVGSGIFTFYRERVVAQAAA